MSAKKMGEIDDLLAEITGDKHKKPATNAGEVDNILKALGKGPKPKAPIIEEPIETPSRPQASANGSERPPKAVAKSSVHTKSGASSASLRAASASSLEPISSSKSIEPEAVLQKADSIFSSFFDDDMKKIVASDAISSTPETSNAGLSNTHIGTQAAASGIAPSDTFKTRDKQQTMAEKFANSLLAESFSEGLTPESKPVNTKKIKDTIKAVSTTAAAAPTPERSGSAGERAVRKLDVSVSSGTLRSKLLSAAKDTLHDTEEEEEYLADNRILPSPNPDFSSQKTAVELAYQEFLGQSSREDASTDVSASSANTVPTLEFDAPSSKLSKKTNSSTVLRPEGEQAPLSHKERRAPSILNSEVDDTFREFFAETVSVRRTDIDEGLRKKASGNLFGRLFAPSPDEDEDEDEVTPLTIGDEDDEGEEEIDDYNSPQDASAIEGTLLSMRATSTMRVIATALICGLLVYLGLSTRAGILPPVPVLDPANEPMLYLVANLALLLLSGLVCFSTLIGGYSSLFKEPSSDILTSICFTGAFLQNLAFLLKPDMFDPLKVTIFAPIAAAALCASAIGKRMQCTTVCRNFETVSVGYDHSAAYLLRNREIAAKVCRELDDDEPALLVSRHTALVKGFLKQSFSQCRHSGTARILGLIVLFVGAIAFVWTLAQTKNIFSSLSALAAVCALCAPFSATILQAVPASLMQRSTARVGAVVPGWSAIEALGTTNAVLINAKDLFPSDCIRLHGIKTFEKERIDLAILYAASILVEGCDTLRDIFLGVIENKTEMLYKVDSLSCEPGLGFTAWVDHTRVIVGNRLIMQKHDISLPSLDYEMKYTKGERSPVYLAVSGKIFGMFLVSYLPSGEADDVLYSLTCSNVSIVIKSDDFNLTSEMVSRLYSIRQAQVKVLNALERDALSPLTAYLPESEGILTHLGTLPSFSGGLRAAAAAQSGIRLAGIVQIAAVILGIALCFLLLISKSLVAISIAAVLLFQLAWTTLTIIMPFTRRYQ